MINFNTNYEDCFAYVSSHGWALKHIHDRHKDYNMCLAAVTDYWPALQLLPDNIINLDILCNTALARHPLALEYVPDDIKTYSMCLSTVTNDGWSISYVPSKFIDHDICIAAVTNNYMAIQSVPEVYRGFELICMVLDQSMTTKLFIVWDVLTPSQQEFIRLKYEL